VILPEHLHTVWTLPPVNADYPGRWMLIKTGFSRHIPQGESRSSSRASKGERGPATPVLGTPHPRRRGFCETCGLLHFNPVKHGHVTRASDWPYSSIHRYIEAGMMDHDWGGGICGNDKSGYGERE